MYSLEGCRSTIELHSQKPCRGTEIRTQNKSSQRTRDSRFTMPRGYLLFISSFSFRVKKISLPFIDIFGMNYISRPRSSIGQSDGLLIRRLCVRFAPRTQLGLWWLWCNGSTTPCGGVCTGSNPVSHPSII